MVADGPGYAFHTFRWVDEATLPLDPGDPPVNIEDKRVVEGVQRSARAGTVRPARRHADERPLLLFSRFLAARLQGQRDNIDAALKGRLPKDVMEEAKLRLEQAGSRPGS